MLLSLLSPELRLLFLAAGDADNNPAILELLKSRLDWAELCRVADRERAVALLWRRIEAVAHGEVPLEAEIHLRKLGRVIHFRMSYLEQLVVQSTSALDNAKIDYTLLKGAALACTAYGSFSERPMVDVDLLVRDEDSSAAVDALVSAGWQWQPDKPRNADYSHLYHLPALVDKHGLVSAEVHTSLLPIAAPFKITTDSVFRSARLTSFQNSQVKVPDPLYLLLHACIHFAWSHAFRNGGWRTFRDVQTMMNVYHLDWPRFIELARFHRAGTCCFWTLHLARELIGAKVPSTVLEALRPPLPAIVLRSLERHFALVLVPSGTLCPSVSLRRMMWVAGILPRQSGHSPQSRPWIARAMAAKDRAAVEDRWEAQRAKKAHRSARHWLDYWSSVLLASPARR